MTFRLEKPAGKGFYLEYREKCVGVKGFLGARVHQNVKRLKPAGGKRNLVFVLQGGKVLEYGRAGAGDNGVFKELFVENTAQLYALLCFTSLVYGFDAAQKSIQRLGKVL